MLIDSFDVVITGVSTSLVDIFEVEIIDISSSLVDSFDLLVTDVLLLLVTYLVGRYYKSTPWTVKLVQVMK